MKNWPSINEQIAEREARLPAVRLAVIAKLEAGRFAAIRTEDEKLIAQDFAFRAMKELALSNGDPTSIDHDLDRAALKWARVDPDDRDTWFITVPGTPTELFHFTSAWHWEAIRAAGLLRPSESNISPTMAVVAPNVVWLLDTDNSDEFEHGLGSGQFKREIRITVDPDRALPWKQWPFTRQMDSEWRQALLRHAGGEDAAEHWWVLAEPLPSDRWIEVRNTITGEILWTPPAD